FQTLPCWGMHRLEQSHSALCSSGSPSPRAPVSGLASGSNRRSAQAFVLPEPARPEQQQALHPIQIAIARARNKPASLHSARSLCTQPIPLLLLPGVRVPPHTLPSPPRCRPRLSSLGRSIAALRFPARASLSESAIPFVSCAGRRGRSVFSVPVRRFRL